MRWKVGKFRRPDLLSLMEWCGGVSPPDEQYAELGICPQDTYEQIRCSELNAPATGNENLRVCPSHFPVSSGLALCCSSAALTQTVQSRPELHPYLSLGRRDLCRCPHTQAPCAAPTGVIPSMLLLLQGPHFRANGCTRSRGHTSGRHNANLDTRILDRPAVAATGLREALRRRELSQADYRGFPKSSRSARGFGRRE